MKILHLYHDLMNLYGDYANLSALCRILSTNGIEYALDKKSLGDDTDFSEYDFIYIGSGSEENQKLALSDLCEKKEELKEYVEKGGHLLLTGNSFEMLGRSIDSFLGSFEGLGLFDFTTVEQNNKRITADAILECEGLDSPLVGFINKCSAVEGVNLPLFTVKMGVGNSSEDGSEGLLYKNLFATHLTGPILVKNPHFLAFVASSLVGEELHTDAFAFEKAGFEITLRKLTERQ